MKDIFFVSIFHGSFFMNFFILIIFGYAVISCNDNLKDFTCKAIAINIIITLASFILSLIILIGLFYFYPYLNFLFPQFYEEIIKDLIINDIPITMQILNRELHKPVKPWIPVESDELEISENIDIIQKFDNAVNDTGIVIYYPSLRYEQLPQKFNISMINEIYRSDSLYVYSEYLDRKLKNLSLSPKPSMDGSDLARQIKAAQGLFPNNQIGISFNIGGAMEGISKLFSGYSFPSQLSVNNIISVKQDFELLAQLWQNGPQTMNDLYRSPMVSQEYTYRHVEKSLIRLYQNGLVRPCSQAQNEQKVKVVYSPEEMIRIVAAFYDITPKEEEKQRAILADFLHHLIMLI